MFSIFEFSLFICLNFLKDHRSCQYSHSEGTGGLFFVVSFQPFVMTFGCRNAILEDNSWNWSRQNFQLKFSFLWISGKFFKLNSAFKWQLADLQIELICFSKFSLLSKVIPKSLTELFDLMSTSLILMVKSSVMVFFLFDNNIAWSFWGFTIIWFALIQFIVDRDSSMSILISEWRSDEYADEVLSTV